MKRILGILILVLLTSCAKPAPVGATHTGFDIDQFVAVTLEREVITDNYKDGHIAAGNSLLLYCIPVPVIKTNPKEEGGVV